MITSLSKREIYCFIFNCDVDKNDERYGWIVEELQHDTIKLVSCSAKVAEIEATQHFVSEGFSWVVS